MISIGFVNSNLLILLATVPALWLFTGAVRDWRHSLIRSAVLILLVTAMARPVAVWENQKVHCALILDDSASAKRYRDASWEALRRQLGKLPTGATASLVHLGNGDLSSIAAEFPQVKTLRSLPDSENQSSLSRALELSAQLIPARTRASVTVISDGLATDDRWADVLQTLSARRIPVHSIVLPVDESDLSPVALQSQQPLRVGETARIRVGIVGNAANVKVVLRAGNKILASRDQVVCEGRTNVVLQFEPEQAGFLELTCKATAVGESDQDSTNNALTRQFAVQQPLRVLYVGRRVTGAREKFASLVGRGFRLIELSDLDYLASDPQSDLRSALPVFDLVMLDDAPAASLPAGLQQELVQAVTEDGVGLVMSGGQAAFGPGGFHKTPIADLLPVEFIQKEEKRDPSTTLVVIIDTSGSMTGLRVQLAKEVARLSMRRLLPHDKVGIVEFYGAKRWAAPIQPASNSIELQRAINRMDAGGGTVILPAIEESFYALQNVQTRYKHVLVLTDGGVEQGAFEPLLRKMAEKGINVSTVLVGGDTHSEFLVNIANWGKGRFYSASNRFSLPEVILKQPTTARIPAYRPGRHPLTAHGGPGWWGTVDKSSVPVLAGYVETSLRPQANSLLKTREGQHPVLASWQYGLGRVTVLTTEPTGPGTETWRDWKSYGALMGRVLRRTARPHSLPFDFEVRRRDDRLLVTATRLVNLPVKPQVWLLDDDGTWEAESSASVADATSERQIEFEQLTPTRFRAQVYYSPDKVARFRAGVEGGAYSTWNLVSTAGEDVAPETQVDPQRSVPFAQWASETGGNSVSLADSSRLETVVGGSDKTLAVSKIWPFLFLLALLFYCGDLLYRRWPRGVATAV